MTDDDVDIFGDAVSEVSQDGLQRIADMLRARNKVNDEVQRLTAELKAASEDLSRYDELMFPELFDEVGVSAFEDEEGNRLEVADKMYGSLPRTDPEKRQLAMEELHRHEGDGLIKSVISITYSKGETDMAHKTLALLAERDIPAQLNEDVHPQTLAAWARERLEAGDPISLETLGLRIRRALKITKPRKSRKKS